MKLFIKILLSLFVIIAFCVLFFVVQLYVEIRGDTDRIVHYKPPIATQIFDRQDRLIANLFEKEFRFYANYEEIPPKLIEALIAIEDTLFFEHPGINLDAIMRAMVKNLQQARYSEGGSTLTQQLIKNVALTREKTIERKVKEMLLALRLETILSKEEILEKYLNNTYFGHGYYGVKTASMGYFHKEMKDLTLKEIAMLVSLPRAPSFYDPTKKYDFSLGRANTVLQRMFELGWITQKELDIGVKESPMVYDETLTQNVAPYVVDEVQRQLKDIKDLKTGGYKIYLNIDLDYQNLAQEALYFGYEQILSRHSKDETLKDSLNGAFVLLENNTGRILALVGGVDYEKSSFNRATQSQRQVGSSIKPFLYQSALNVGFSQNYQIPDIARTYQYRINGKVKQWQPKNYGNKIQGFVDLKTALTKSLNLATINLVEEVGFERIYRDILDYGFKNVPKDLSISLGSFGASPVEMAKNFTIFSNYGKVVEPQLISAIINYNGEINNFSFIEEERISKEQSFLMVDILRSVVNSGTGGKARVKGLEIAGKTGTTNKNVDSWFCGFTPSLEAVIWYGKDDNTSMGYSETGGVAAAPVFAYFFEKLLEKDPGIPRNFNVPENVRKRVINDKIFYYTKESPIFHHQETTTENNILF